MAARHVLPARTTPGGVVGYSINLVNGKGVLDGRVIFDLSELAAGTFECAAHAEVEGYSPPLFAYVEHAAYRGCRGTGDFAGGQMLARVTNEARPGQGEYDGVAALW